MTEQQRIKELETFLKRHWEFVPEDVKTFEEAERYFMQRVEEGIKFRFLGFLNLRNLISFINLTKNLTEIEEVFLLGDLYKVLYENMQLSIKTIPNSASEFSPAKMLTYKKELQGNFVIPKTYEAARFLLGEMIIKAIF